MRVKSKEVVALKRKLRKNKVCGLALDIDDTVSGTVAVWMEKMVLVLGNPENLSIEDLVAKYGYGSKINCWSKTAYESATMLVRYSNEFYEDLPLIDGVKDSIIKINQVIPIAAFITARPKGVRNGTKKWIKKNGLINVPVIDRPMGISLEQQTKWKARVLEYLYPEIQGIVDDNLGLVNCLNKKYKGKVFLYGQTETINDSISVVPCKDWTEVLTKVKDKFSGGNG